MDDGKGNVTAEELEVAKTRPHPLDKKDFIALIKKAVKDKTIRINVYIFKELHDGFMLKVELEKFLGGVSMGTRWVKGYLTTETKTTIEKLIDDIPKKPYLDTRDQVTRYRPLKIEKRYEEAPTDLDLDDLWNTIQKG